MATLSRGLHSRRATITALPLYYSGHLQMRVKKDKEFKKFFGELRGTTLFLYKDDSQETYSDKLSLDELESMEAEFSNQNKIIFSLKLHTSDMQLKMKDAKSGEEWRAYILTVVKKELPSKVELLPGQLLKLKETLSQEKKRTLPLPHPPLPPRPSFLSSAPCPPPTPPPKDNPEPELPECFFPVCREEAERMLEANPEYGDMILRPSTTPNCYAVTLRQLMSSGPVMRNFRVTTTSAGLLIELETPVVVPTLNDVLKYFLEKTDYRLHPYTLSHGYDTRLDLQKSPSGTSSTPKVVPQAQVAPMQRAKPKEEPTPLPSPPEEEESMYMVPEDDSVEEHDMKIVPNPPNMDKELKDILKARRAAIYATD